MRAPSGKNHELAAALYLGGALLLRFDPRVQPAAARSQSAKRLELPHEVDHLAQLRAADLGEHRQGQDLTLVAMLFRELLGAMTEPLARNGNAVG